MDYLFPTDGSQQSIRVGEILEDMADPDSDTVTVLTVIEDDPNPMASPENQADYETALISEAEKIVDAAVDRFRNHDIDASTEIEHGHPGTVICRLAEESGVDQIVMGRRGRGTAGELLLGSVSRYVTHHADCPVTVVPPE